jgi:L-rhamnose isomerase/sugar isomerase
VLAQARQAAGGAIDPIATYRASGYRQRKARERRELAPGTGIV